MIVALTAWWVIGFITNLALFGNRRNPGQAIFGAVWYATLGPIWLLILIFGTIGQRREARR